MTTYYKNIVTDTTNTNIPVLTFILINYVVFVNTSLGKWKHTPHNF